MSKIQIIEVQTRRQRRAFFRFPMDLYKPCAFYVPPLLMDEYETFSEKNPAYRGADSVMFLARRGRQVVGRIAGIILHEANKHDNARNVRFGWFDSINDRDVAAALFDAVSDWAVARGMDTLVGPLGFSGLDKEGMLTEGFDSVPTMATYYNYPYYVDLVEAYGFETELDLVEYLIMNITSNPFPPRLAALAERVRKRRRFRVLKFANKREMLARAPGFLDLLIDTYQDLDGFTPISEEQKAYITKKFFPFLRTDLVQAIVNEDDELIGFFVAMPSISRALQWARGRLLPFGIFHLWRALRGRDKIIDFCLAGVRKPYRGLGVDVLMAVEMHKAAMRLGFETGESNPELEHNLRVRAEWKHFDHRVHRRRKIYTKRIGQATATSDEVAEPAVALSGSVT